jgi:hypothetical protein
MNRLKEEDVKNGNALLFVSILVLLDESLEAHPLSDVNPLCKTGLPLIQPCSSLILSEIGHPIEPVCAHSGFVLILSGPGLYQPCPDEFTSIFREFRTFPGFVSDSDLANSFKMTSIYQNKPNLRNDSL